MYILFDGHGTHIIIYTNIGDHDKNVVCHSHIMIEILIGIYHGKRHWQYTYCIYSTLYLCSINGDGA